MKRAELIKIPGIYEEATIRVTYKTDIGTQIRVGIAKAFGIKVLMFWPVDYDDETDSELLIEYPCIEDAEPLIKNHSK